MEKIRIKDIALRSGVSVGTVDRVLHNRPNVSKKAREKVEKALKEVNYQPNMYASALAYNRSYNIVLLIPQHEQEAYWQEIEYGVAHSEEARRDFRINVTTRYYQRFNDESFQQVAQEVLDANPDGVVVIPGSLEATRPFADELHRRDIPFIMLDSNLQELNPTSFIGQDSLASGYFAGKMFTLLLGNDERQVMLFRQSKGGRLSSRQQENRERGFMKFMQEHNPDIEICQLDIPRDTPQEEFDRQMGAFLNEHPDIHNCITMNSRAHVVADYLYRNNLKQIQIMGYDMVAKNADYMRKGVVSFLICQHAYMQGYFSMEALFRYIVLKKEIRQVSYMPIELISRENVDYYRRSYI